MRNHKNILNFSQRRLTMKTLLLFLFMFAVTGIQTMAETTAPVPAPTPPIRIGIPRPTPRPGAGEMNPGLKKAIADKAAIDKILSATVSKVEFEMSKIPSKISNKAYMSGTVSLFGICLLYTSDAADE